MGIFSDYGCKKSPNRKHHWIRHTSKDPDKIGQGHHHHIHVYYCKYCNRLKS